MTLVVTIDTTTNKILSQEEQTAKTVVVEWVSLNDTLIVDEQTNEVVKLQDSTQGKRRVTELQAKKELDEFEKVEYNFLTDKETPQEKFTDQEEAQEILLSGQYIVNITNKGKKKIAKIVERTMTDKLELDTDRWDRWFNSLKEAEAYANTFNS